MMPKEWHTYYDGPLARVKVEFFGGYAFAHITVRQWGMATMRALKDLFPNFLRMLNAIGFRRVYAYHEPDDKWRRFVRMLGFSELRMRNGYLVVGRSTAK